MCEAIRALVEDGRQEGRREGENDGIELARQIFKLAGKGEKIPEIARRLSIPEEKVRWVLRSADSYDPANLGRSFFGRGFLGRSFCSGFTQEPAAEVLAGKRAP